MKKVLLIAYHFPPVGGAGVQRTSKFVKYLRNFGWEPLVLSRDPGKMELRDHSLIKDIPEDIKIWRTTAWDFNVWPGLLKLPGKLIGRKILIPDAERLWQLSARKTAAKIVRDGKVDLIYTTSSPYSAHLMGLHLKKLFPGIPWVADFRDEWMNNPYLLDNPHCKPRMRIESSMERQVLETADCLITNTPFMLDNFINNHRELLLENKFFTIPNGFDPEDFSEASVAAPNNIRFTITYTGALYGRRKPDTFFAALSSLIRSGEIDKNTISVQFTGHFHIDRLKQQVEREGLQGAVEFSSYIEHDECIKRLTGSDCLLLIEGGGRGSEAFFTGKIFEYINAGRPILANIPFNGAAAQVIRDTATGLVSDCDDVDTTAANLLTFYKSWLHRNNEYSPNHEAISRYDRKALTKRLAEVFEKAQG